MELPNDDVLTIYTCLNIIELCNKGIKIDCKDSFSSRIEYDKKKIMQFAKRKIINYYNYKDMLMCAHKWNIKCVIDVCVDFCSKYGSLADEFNPLITCGLMDEASACMDAFFYRMFTAEPYMGADIRDLLEDPKLLVPDLQTMLLDKLCKIVITTHETLINPDLRVFPCTVRNIIIGIEKVEDYEFKTIFH